MRQTTALARRDPGTWGPVPLAHLLQEIEVRSQREVDAQTGIVSYGDPALEIVAYGMQLVLRKIVEVAKGSPGRVAYGQFAPQMDRLISLGLLLTYTTVTAAYEAFEREVLVPIRRSAQQQRENVMFAQIVTVPSAMYFAALYKRGREYCERVEGLHQKTELFRIRTETVLTLESSTDTWSDVVSGFSKPAFSSETIFRDNPARVFRLVLAEEHHAGVAFARLCALARLPYKAGVLETRGFDLMTRTVARDLVRTHIVLALSLAPASSEYADVAALEVAVAKMRRHAFDPTSIFEVFLERMRARGMTSKFSRAELHALRQHVVAECTSMAQECVGGGAAGLYDSMFIDLSNLGSVDVAQKQSEEVIATLHVRDFLCGEATQDQTLSNYVESMPTPSREVWLDAHIRPRITFEEYSGATAFNFLCRVKEEYAVVVFRWMSEDLHRGQRTRFWERILETPESLDHDLYPGVLRAVLSHPEYKVGIDVALQHFDCCPRDQVIAVLDHWFTAESQQWVKNNETGKVVNLMAQLTRDEASRYWEDVQYRRGFVGSVMRLYADSLPENSVRSLRTLFSWLGTDLWVRGLVAYFYATHVQDLPAYLKVRRHDKEDHPFAIRQCEEMFESLFSDEHSLRRRLKIFITTRLDVVVKDWLASNTEDSVYLWLYAAEESPSEHLVQYRALRRRVGDHLRHMKP